MAQGYDPVCRMGHMEDAASQAGNPVLDEEVDDPCMPITHGQHIDWKEVALFFKIYTE
jgi:hypothetical protein